ncbi:MAG TPA: ATP-binding protein [Bacteroidales bacterium]
MKDSLGNVSLKGKVALGYLLIFLASAIAIIFLYQGIKNLQRLDETNTSPNEKLYKINQILTLIYEAENQTRSYFLLRNKSDFDDYIQTLNKIGSEIDKLSIDCYDNPKQLRHLNTIKNLLMQKKDVIRQLMDIKSPNRREFLYARALEEIYIQAYELSKMSRIVKEKVTITRDSIAETPQKKTFIQRFKGIFSSEEAKLAKEPKVAVEKETQSDTIVQEGISPDTLVKTLKHALENLKTREDYLQDQSVTHETQLLYNDRVLLDKIREIVTLLETEELANINRVLRTSSSILQRASYVSMVLAIISVLLIVVFLVLIFRDISLNKQRQLALQMAKQQAEQLIRLKEQFLANMSHEIRTPLGTIIGFAEQLQKTELQPKQAKYLDTIDKASEHLLGLVNDILDLSKIEAGKLTLEKVRFNLTDLLQEVCQSLSLKAKEKNLDLQLQVSPDLNRELKGDPFRIRQVMINIVGNAIKFTEKGSVTVNADVLSSNDACVVARIDIIDTGIGIAEEKQKEIFEDFSQADTGTSRKYGGTGLGLAISRRIVELCEGSINLNSTMGQGSTFTLEIPFEMPDQSDMTMAGQTDAKIPLDEIVKSINGKRVLVAEDDEITLLLVSSLLENAGAAVDVVDDFATIHDLLERKPFDLVITDIHMPGMNGFDFVQLIRSYPNKNISEVPVVALTANVSNKEELMKSGFNGYLSKPFKEASFYHKIYSVLTSGYSMETQEESSPVLFEQSAPYSFNEIVNFTGNDPEALKLVVSTFVEKSLLVITEMNQLADKADLEGISFRAHKLLPSFKQFQISSLIDDLVKLERYEEMGLPAMEFIAITRNFGTAALLIINQIKEEVEN